MYITAHYAKSTTLKVPLFLDVAPKVVREHANEYEFGSNPQSALTPLPPPPIRLSVYKKRKKCLVF